MGGVKSIVLGGEISCSSFDDDFAATAALQEKIPH